jgi:hypothetical protein
MGNIGGVGSPDTSQQVDQTDQVSQSQDSAQATDSSQDSSWTHPAGDAGTPDVLDSHSSDSFASGLMDRLQGAVDKVKDAAKGAVDNLQGAAKSGATADMSANVAAGKAPDPGAVGGDAKGPAKDSDPLPKDPKAALGGFNQKNSPGKTGEDRCGASTVVARTLKEQGYDGLKALNDKVQKDWAPSGLSPERQQALKDLQAATDRLTADPPPTPPPNYGDLGKYNAALQTLYKGGQGASEGEGGMQPRNIERLNELAGNSGQPDGTTRADNAKPFDKMKPGDSYPAKINVDLKDGGPGNHWVVAGKDEKGPYFYDPYPRAGHPQVVREGDSNYQKYLRQMNEGVKNENKGFMWS